MINEEVQDDKEEVISLVEAYNRMQFLTDMISNLKAEKEELLSKDGMPEVMDELKALRARVKFYESS